MDNLKYVINLNVLGDIFARIFNGVVEFIFCERSMLKKISYNWSITFVKLEKLRFRYETNNSIYQIPHLLSQSYTLWPRGTFCICQTTAWKCCKIRKSLWLPHNISMLLRCSIKCFLLKMKDAIFIVWLHVTQND